MERSQAFWKWQHYCQLTSANARQYHTDASLGHEGGYFPFSSGVSWRGNNFDPQKLRRITKAFGNSRKVVI